MNVEVSTVSQTSIDSDDVIIIKVPIGRYDINYTRSILQTFGRCFPNNKRILIPDDCKIQIINQLGQDFIPATQEELFDFLDINNQLEEKE